MAQFTPLQASTTNTNSSTSVTLATHLTLSGLAANEEYIVYGGWEMKGDGAGGDCGVSLYYGSTGLGSARRTYSEYIGTAIIGHIQDTGASPDDITIQYNQIGSGTAYCQAGKILAIPVHQLTPKLHFMPFANGGSVEVTDDSAWSTLATLDFSGLSASNGDNWFVHAAMSVIRNAAAAHLEVRLNKNSGAVIGPTITFDIEDSSNADFANIIGYGFSINEGDTVDVEVKLQTGSASVYAATSAMAWNVSQFDQGTVDNETAFTTSAASSETAGTAPYTQDASVDYKWLMFNTGVHEGNESGGQTAAGLNFYDSGGMTTIDNGRLTASTNDGDNIPNFTFHLQSLTGGGETGTYDGYTDGVVEESTSVWPDFGPLTHVIFLASSDTAADVTAAEILPALQPLSEPVHPPPQGLNEAFVVGLGVPIPTPAPDFDWYRPLSRPVEAEHPRFPLEGVTIVDPKPLPTEAPAMDSWYMPLSEPVVPPPPALNEGSIAAAATSQGSESEILRDWYRPLAEPVHMPDQPHIVGGPSVGWNYYSAQITDFPLKVINENVDGPGVINESVDGPGVINEGLN